MRIETEVTGKDYAEFNKYYFFRKNVWITIGIYLIVSLSVPLYNNLNGEFQFERFLYQLLVFAILFGCIYFIIGYFGMRFLGLMPSKNGIVLGKKIYTITSDGLQEEGEQNTTKIKWNSIRSIEEDDHRLYIFIDTIAAFIIPIKSFKNSDEKEKFIHLIKEKNKKLE